MCRATSLAAVAVFGLAVVMTGTEARVHAGQTPDGAPTFDGEWRLDDELSDGPNPRSWRGKRRGGGNRQGNGGFGGGFGGFGRRGGFGGRPDHGQPSRRDNPAGERAARQGAIEDLTTAPRRMTITTGRREIELRYNDGRVVRLIPDDREHSGLAGTELAVKRVTSWKGETLTTQIDIQTRQKFRVRQTYALSLEGTRLTVASQYEGDGVGDDEDREFRQVYERVSTE